MKKLYTAALAGLLVTSLTACEKKQEEAVLPTVAEQAKQDAEEAQTGGVSIDNLFIRESFPGQKVSAAYFTLTNHSGKDVEVTEVSSNVSGVTEFHTMEMKDSKMVMRKMDKVVIPANGSLILKQGGDHLMFIDLNKSLVAGDKVHVDIKLNNGETIDFDGKVAETKDDMKDMHNHSDHAHHDHAHDDMHNHDEHQKHEH